MKDSKKFSSVKKINQTADYIKENAIAWAVAYIDEKDIELLAYLEIFSFFFFLLLGGCIGILLLHLLRGGRQQESLPHSEIGNICIYVSY